uniref:Uncharacterized protein n=1 Tax=Kalanchoe fedtschenkoi TaxID=63787 RepID=A0A7N0TBQ5_KALFE
MADPDDATPETNQPRGGSGCDSPFAYLGVAFAVYLAVTRPVNVSLAERLAEAEAELEQMRSRRKEDAKANARVVEIFASHRHAWRQEERRLHRRIHESAAEAAALRARVGELEREEARLKEAAEELRRELGERTEMVEFMSRRVMLLGDGELGARVFEEDEDGGDWVGKFRVSEEVESGCCVDENGGLYGGVGSNGFNPEMFRSAASKFWSKRSNHWQDTPYEPVETHYEMKHFVARRESPWKVDSESSGVSSKLKLLELELSKLEKVGGCDSSKLPSLLRKQAKRYQALAGKIDDLCKRMQASDPCEPDLTPEFRTQRQTEFLLEAFRLQQRASETAQKQIALQTETGKTFQGDDEVGGHAHLVTKRSFDSIKNNFKDIQRNLEIWLARIIGDLEGILARDGASRLREYYVSRYPFVQ